MVTSSGFPQRVLYASDVVPGPGGGGSVIAERHLQRLAENGMAVSVLTPADPAALRQRHPSWNCLATPARQWWWPPFRPAWPAVTGARSFASRRALQAAGLTDGHANVIVTICWGATSWQAADLARRWQRPLVAIVHDWWLECGGATEARIGERVCRAAQKILVVSEEMKTALANFGPEKIEVLYPVPADRVRPFAAWRPAFAREPVVAHVGALHPYHADYLTVLARELASLGGRLLVLCPAANPVLATLRAQIPNLAFHDSFPTNEAAVQWIAEQAAAVTVMYPPSPEHTPTGFPSRLVEFAQTGLPILIAASPNNPVRTWAARHDWQAQLEPADRAQARHLLEALTRPADWERFAAQTRAAAAGDFDPSRLHAQFHAALRNARPGQAAS